MGLIKGIKDLVDDMTAWRHHLHAHPELSGQEKNTAAFIEQTLTSFGLQVERVGDYGVVAILSGTGNASGKSIMLRADTDALPINEQTGLSYASQNKNVMHACGHDGHTAMLLGAAKFLKDNNDFDGTVYFLFQPAEETGEGAADMIRNGLFTKFPVSEIYGLHNTPNFPLSLMGTRKGDMLSAATAFNIKISGKGGHASNPKKATNVLGAASQAVLDVQKEFKKHIAKGDKAVLTVTSLQTSSAASNVLSDHVVMSGTIRSFNPASEGALKKFLEKTVTRAAKSAGADINISYNGNFPALKNTPAETSTALSAARDTQGLLRVIGFAPKTLGTEDFAYLLKEKPGNYMAMGTGPIKSLATSKDIEGLRSAKYDFNDAALPIGASYWVNLVGKALPKPKTQNP